MTSWMDDGDTINMSNQGNDVLKMDLFLEMKRLILEHLNWKILKDHMSMTISEVKWRLKANV